MPQRDDVEALASIASVLLKGCGPDLVADRFLRRVAREYRAEAGLFYIAGDRPHLTVLGLDPDEALRLASELSSTLTDPREPCRTLEGVGSGRPWTVWSHALAVTAGIYAEERSVLALFSTKPLHFDAARDGRLLRHLIRQAAQAVAREQRSERQRQEAERLAVRAEEVEWVRRALVRHSRELERKIAMRHRFLALLSHELRTPINAIVGYSDLLHGGILGGLNARQSDAALKIGSSARQLLFLVNDLLDLARLETRGLKIEPAPVELAALVTDSAAAVAIDAEAKGLELRTVLGDPLPVIESDGARIRQILLNLLSNAVKFTHSGRITLEARHLPAGCEDGLRVPPRCAPGASGWVALTVEDTGPGIAAEERDRVFDEFVQLEHTSEASAGSGLGLSISRQLAKLLGGELVLDSEVGVRSTFILYLPCPSPAIATAWADA